PAARHKSSNPFPLIIPKCVAIHRRSPKISVESDLLSSGNPRSLIRHYDLVETTLFDSGQPRVTRPTIQQGGLVSKRGLTTSNW
ncbi:MAG: hypothetical protein KGR71_16915, partial [Proteobacteria bacterium]|nr:hypothetical protein [Pseudomonadota bacterium]